MSVEIQPVPNEYVAVVWKDVEALLAESVAVQSDYTLAQVKLQVMNGAWQLLVAVDDKTIVGTATVHYYNAANDRVAFVTFTAGRFIAVPESLAGLKAVVKANGATCIEGAGRPAISRLWKQHFGFQDKHTVFQLKLED